MVRIIKKAVKCGFVKTKLPGADYVINQYIGCEHACKYCYARFLCKKYNYGEWGSWVIVKENIPELIKNKKITGKVYMSSVSDPYQPVEKKIKLTKKILQSLDKSVELSILTKSPLVLRDINLLKKFNKIEVGLTINSLGKDIEPRAPSNERRIQTLKKLYEAGLNTYCFVSPIIPHLTDLEYIIKETKNFVNYYWFEFLNLNSSGDFSLWLKHNYPESYKILSKKEHLREYVKNIKELIKKLKIKGNLIVHSSSNFNIFHFF